MQHSEPKLSQNSCGGASKVGFLQTGQFGLMMLVVGGDMPCKEMNKPRGNGVCHQSVCLDTRLGKRMAHFLELSLVPC